MWEYADTFKKPRIIFLGLFALILLPVFLFILTGCLDYFYVHYLVKQFEGGLAEVDFANPHLGKALVSAVSATVSYLYLRHAAMTPQSIQKYMGFTITLGFACFTLIHTITGITTWGHYFDSFGRAVLRYEITFDNQIVFYSNHTISPRTGRELQEVTPGVVHELEARRRAGSFKEVFSPVPEDWFASGTAEPMLWFSEREDGIHVFNMPGYDPSNKTSLEPVTTEIQQFYYDQKRIREERAAQKAAAIVEEKRLESVALQRAETRKQDKLSADNARLRLELEKQRRTAELSAATPTPLTNKAFAKSNSSPTATPKGAHWEVKFLPINITVERPSGWQGRN